MRKLADSFLSIRALPAVLAALTLAACTHHVDPVGTGGSAGTGGGGGGAGAGGSGGAAACLSPGDACQEAAVCPGWDCYCNDPQWSFHVAQACTNYQCHDGPAGCAGDCANFGGVAFVANLGCDPDFSCHDAGAPCFDASQCHGWSCDCVDPGNHLDIASACVSSKCVNGPADCIDHCATHGGISGLEKVGTCPP